MASERIIEKSLETETALLEYEESGIFNKMKALIPYLYMGPAALFIIVFVYMPVVSAFLLSFSKWSVHSTEYVGLQNYITIFKSEEFWNALKNTIVFTVGTIPVSMFLGLVLALIINRLIFFRGGWRTIFFLPVTATVVALATVWQLIFHPEFGALNGILSLVGIGKLNWINDSSTAMFALLIVSNWTQTGYNMVLFLAGLTNIPKNQYEAAEIDGAGKYNRFWHVTWPMLSPATLFILVISMIRTFQAFALIKVMTEGGPIRSTEVLTYIIYKNAFMYYRMGYGSALAFILFIILLSLTIFQTKFFGRRTFYQ